MLRLTVILFWMISTPLMSTAIIIALTLRWIDLTPILAAARPATGLRRKRGVPETMGAGAALIDRASSRALDIFCADSAGADHRQRGLAG